MGLNILWSLLYPAVPLADCNDSVAHEASKHSGELY